MNFTTMSSVNLKYQEIFSKNDFNLDTQSELLITSGPQLIFKILCPKIHALCIKIILMEKMRGQVSQRGKGKSLKNITDRVMTIAYCTNTYVAISVYKDTCQNLRCFWRKLAQKLNWKRGITKQNIGVMVKALLHCISSLGYLSENEVSCL